MILVGCAKKTEDHLLLAENYLRDKKYDKAIFEFYEYMLTNPDDPRAYQGSAEAYLNMGEKAKAIEQYMLMIEHFPKYLDGYSAVVPLLNKEETIALYNKYISEMPDSVSGYLLLGNFLKENGEKEEAQNVFLDVLSKFPYVPEGYIEVALYYYDSFRYLTAITVLVDGIRLTGDSRVLDTYIFVAGHLVVEWHDSYLETVIRNYLSLPNGAVTLDKLSGITSIELNGEKTIHPKTTNPSLGKIVINGLVQPSVSGQLKSLEDFSSFINLTELHIRSFPLDSLNSLNSMPNLKILTVSGTDIKDLSILEKMDSLESLNLDDNRIVSLEPLRGLGKIVTLSLADNYIEDLLALKDMSSLKTVIVRNNRITNIDSIIDIHALDLIDLSGNKIKDISRLKEINATEILFD